MIYYLSMAIYAPKDFEANKRPGLRFPPQSYHSTLRGIDRLLHEEAVSVRHEVYRRTRLYHRDIQAHDWQYHKFISAAADTLCVAMILQWDVRRRVLAYFEVSSEGDSSVISSLLLGVTPTLRQL